MAPLEAGDVCAIVPCHDRPPVPGLLEALAAIVGDVLVVADGMPADHEVALRARAAAAGARVVRLERRSGKGHAIAAGLRALSSSPPPPEGVLVVDADGQHPLDAIPRFLAAAATADLVVGNRIGRSGRMPPVRRIANRISSGVLSLAVRSQVPDSQCGMRLLRGRALHDVEFPPGGFESETRHLKRCMAAGVPVAWVRIPAIYAGQPSAFRPVADSAAVLAAILAEGAAARAEGRLGGRRSRLTAVRQPPPAPPRRGRSARGRASS